MGFILATILLISSCLGIAFFPGIWMWITLLQLVVSTLGALRAVTKISHMAIGNITQCQYVQ